MEARHWKISIPVRPKAVQSTRFDRGVFHADSKVRKWKAEIEPYIRAQSPGEPTDLPVRVVRIRYVYKLPKGAKRKVVEFVKGGGEIPYLAAGDLTDNLSKGIIDVCKGIVFTDDRIIYSLDDVKKVYGLDDRIELEFEEVPGLLLVDGHISGE